MTDLSTVPILSNAAFHHSPAEIFSMPVPSNAFTCGSVRDGFHIPVSSNSAFSDDAKNLNPGRPRKIPISETKNLSQGHQDGTGNVPVPISFNVEILSMPVSSNDVFLNSAGDIASGGSQGKRKRGRPRKNENRPVPLVKGKANVVKACDDAKERVEKKEELLNVNRNGDAVNLEDPFGAELRRRTEGMKTEAELLGFLGGLEGEWGSWRRKKKIVQASLLGDTLPRGWKIQISIKKKKGHVSLFCRRYISPNGQQFVSCKEVSSYLLTSSGIQDAGQSKPGLADGNVQVANKVGSGDEANLSFEDGKNADVPVSCSRVPITFVSTDHGEQAIFLETRNLGEGRIPIDEEKPSSLEANEKVSCESLHGKLVADSLTEACADRQRADTATCMDRGSGELVPYSHVEKVKNGSKDEKHQEFCEKQDKVRHMTNKNELGELDEVIKVGETASSNKNGNSFELSDSTSVVKCVSITSSVEEPKRNVDPGTALLASSSESKICSTADRQFARTAEDRNDESTSGHCWCWNEEERGPTKDANRSLTSITIGLAHDKSPELGLSSSSIDERTCLVGSEVNNVSSRSKFPNEKMISSGSSRVTSDVDAVTPTKHDRSSGRCLSVPPSNEQSFWDDGGFESNVFTSFDNEDNANNSSFDAIDTSKVNDAKNRKDTGIYANPVACMEQVGNFRGGSDVLSSNESKCAWRDNLVSDRQTEEVKQDGGSLDSHVLDRSDYFQSSDFMDGVNNIFSSSMEESKYKEVNGFWNNEVLHSFGSIDTGTDANAGAGTLKGQSSEGLSPVVSRSGQTFPNTNNVEELELKKCSDIDSMRGADDMKRISSSTLWEQPKPEETNKSRTNELMTCSDNHSRTYGNVRPEVIWRTGEHYFQPSSLVDTSSAPMQLSGCFPNFNILSEKDAYGDLNGNERFETISDLEGLGLGSTEQLQYNFLTTQGTLNSNESKVLSHAEIKHGFDSSIWLAKESLTLFPKTASGHQTLTICIWCRKEFYHQGVSSGTKSGSVGLMCATCQAKFSV